MSEQSEDPDRERELAEFVSTCRGIGDPILLVLRVHLYTEYLLDRLIMATLARADRVLDDGALTYAQKLSLVAAFDCLRDTDVTAMRNLNRVRNRCAHERQKTITLADVELIARPFGDLFARTRKERNDDVGKCLNDVLAWLCGGLAYDAHRLERIKAESGKSG